MSEPVAELLKIDRDKLPRRVVSVDLIDANPWNPNRMDERTFAAARASIRRFGFIDACLARPNPEYPDRWQIIDGEHRWKAAIEEGYGEVLIDDIGPISDLDAKTLTITFNETRGDADIGLMGKLIVDIEREGGDDYAETLPFSDAELKHYSTIGRVDWDDFDRSGGNGDAGGGGEKDGDGEKDESAGTTTLVWQAQEELDAFTNFTQMLGHEAGTDRVEDVVLTALREQAAKL